MVVAVWTGKGPTSLSQANTNADEISVSRTTSARWTHCRNCMVTNSDQPSLKQRGLVRAITARIGYTSLPGCVRSLTKAPRRRENYVHTCEWKQHPTYEILRPHIRRDPRQGRTQLPSHRSHGMHDSLFLATVGSLAERASAVSSSSADTPP